MKTITDIQKCHQAGQLAEAKAGYRAILQENPQHIIALHWLGVLYAEEGNINEAAHCLMEAMSLSPHDPTLSLHFANILKTKGELDQAVAVLQALLKQHPTFVAAYNNLGTIYFAQGCFQEAIAAYHSAIDIQPNYADAYYNLGLVLTKNHQLQEAMNVYTALLELSPEHAGGHFHLGCLLMQNKAHDKALQHFLLIEQHHPYHAETQINIATCYLRLHKIDQAKMHYLKALEIVPNDIQALFNLGVIYMRQNHVKEAVEAYLQAVNIDPDFYEAHHNLGFVFLTIGDKNSALSHFREALRIHPGNTAIQHTIDILIQKKGLAGSPPEYISALFNSYADHFDSHLLQSLHYQVPKLMYEAVRSIQKSPDDRYDILDLGCGTGLGGEVFKCMAKTLAGVDLSEQMLWMAAQKKIYDELMCADIIDYLQDKFVQSAQFDLMIAADVFVYIGDLEKVMTWIAKALRPQGLLVFNTEISEEENYQLTQAGRFAHRQSYLDALLAQCGFTILERRIVTLRTQNQQPVRGYLYVVSHSEALC